MKTTYVQPEAPLVGPGWPKAGLRPQTSPNLLWLVTMLVWLMALNTVVAQTNAIQLLSARNPSLPMTAGGDGDSIGPLITPDGRYVVFSSVANDLTPGGNDRFVLNIYLRDRTAQTTTLVSPNKNGTGGGNDNSLYPQVSSNGQFVVFQSDASDLVPNDTNGVTDIFMRNVTAGTTTLVSAAPDGSPGNGPSTDPAMTPDGRYVAFISSASNLTSGIGGVMNVFVRDMVLGTNYLISVGARETNADMATPVITPDGRYVAFFSTSTNLVPGVLATSNGEVYVRDRMNGTTTWASTNAAAIALADLGVSNAASYHPRLSDDGQYVVFKAGSNNIIGAAVILQYDMATAATTVINTNGLAWLADDSDDYGPEMTPDGEFVAYVQHEGDTNSNSCSVHVWDSHDGTDRLVSDPGNNGVITTASTQPELSADGWFVAFLSNATNLVDDPVQSGVHIYLRNYLQGSLQLVDEDTNGVGSTDNTLALFSLSRYGRYVAFDSQDGSLVSGDNNHAYDVFTRDLFWNTTELVSKRDAALIPQTGDNLCEPQVSVSTNGQWVAFASVADDLVPDDTNNEPDVFIRNLLTGTITLVSVGADGGPAWASPSVSPVISGQGRYVVFISAATNLVASQGVTTSANVFRRDLQADTTVLVSVGTNGIDAANGDCSDPVVSQDGQYVAFLSAAGNLVPGVSLASVGSYRTFLRDLNMGTTTALTNGTFALSQAPVSVFPPSMSADGRYVAYSSYAGTGYVPQLRIWDDQLGTDVYTNTASISNAVLNADGTRVLYSEAPNSTLVDDVLTGTNVFTFNYPFMMCGSGGFSASGQYFTFVARTNAVSSTNIYLCDLQTGAITLVSSDFTPVETGAGGHADLPVISADGRFVVYRSYAFGIVPGDISPVPNIYRYDRLLGTNRNLTAGQAGLSFILWDSKPVVSDNGGTVAFLSLGSGLVSEDLNRTLDVFAYAVDVGMPLDSDGDGIPDWWMIQYFGHPTGQASDHSLAGDDADGDGMSNLQEYLAGTSPVDPQSALRMITVTEVKPGPELDISWSSVTNKLYFLERSSDLAAQPAFSVIQSNIVGQAGVTTYPDTSAVGSGPYFYRVGLQQ